MGIVPEVKLVIKHTFLEYVGDNKASSNHSLTRQRSNTEPAILDNPCYAEVRELLHGGDSSSSSSSSFQGDPSADNFDPWQTEPTHSGLVASVLATPESTPLLYPVARHVTGWLQEDWAEGLLPEAFCPQAVDEYCHWNEQPAMGDWWMPNSFEHGMSNECCDFSAGMDCKQFQVDYSGMDQMYAPITINAESVNASQFVQNETPGVMLAASAVKETRTTVMLRDLPESYSRTSLLKLLDAQGFFGRFDFVYLPVDFKHRRNLGYALINLVSPCEALRLTKHFEGFSNWGVASDRLCSVGWCSPQQGLEAHVERYRNSPVMHESVPEEWQPLLLSHGVPIPFPAPTTKIKAPKVKGRHM